MISMDSRWPNQALQPTAPFRCVSAFHIFSFLSVVAEPRRQSGG